MVRTVDAYRGYPFAIALRKIAGDNGVELPEELWAMPKGAIAFTAEGAMG